MTWRRDMTELDSVSGAAFLTATQKMIIVIVPRRSETWFKIDSLSEQLVSRLKNTPKTKSHYTVYDENAGTKVYAIYCFYLSHPFSV